MSAPRFPLFISLDGQDALIVGGGKIAARRARTLLMFGASVTIISPEISDETRTLLDRVVWRRERYRGFDKTYTLAVAATDERETNRRVGEDAKAAGIPVSVADRREESTFWFPAVIRGNGLVAGMVSEDGDHKAVKRAAEIIRRQMEEEL